MNNQWFKILAMVFVLLTSAFVQAQWTKHNVGLDGADVHTLVISPVASDTLYALSSKFSEINPPVSDFFLSSDDFGLNWVTRSLAFPETTLTHLVASRLSAQTLLGLSSQGIYKSSNAGKDWRKLYPDKNESVHDLKTCHANPSTLYAVSFMDILKSTDEGGHWVKRFSLPSNNTSPEFEAGPPDLEVPFFSNPGPTQLAIDPDNCDTLYLISENSIGKSVDGGQTWFQLNILALPSNFLISSITAGLKSGVLFIASRESKRGIYRSVDGGESWHSANAGIESVAIDNVITDPNHPNRLFAINQQGLWVTLDSGDSWQRIAPTLQSSILTSLAIDPADSNRMYLSTTTGVFQTTDGGAHWHIRNTGMHDVAHINNLQTLTSDNNVTLFAATSVGGFKLDAASADWQRLGGVVGTLSLDDLLSTGEDLWAVESQSFLTNFVETQPIFHSQDDGQSWRSLQVKAGVKFATLSAVPGHRLPYLGGLHPDGTRVIYRGLDETVSWQPLTDNLPDLISNQASKPFDIPKPRVTINPANPASLYIDSLYQFNSGIGQPLTHLNGLPARQKSGVMAFDPFNTSRQYAGVSAMNRFSTDSPADSLKQGFYISEDGGQNWRKTSLVSFDVYAIQIDPDDRNTIYVLHQGGIAKSTDAGESWSAFNQGLADIQTFWWSGALAMHGNKLYVGAYNGILTCAQSACESDTPATATVIEFYNTELDHYFLTASEGEAELVETGRAGPGWIRTGESFGAWTVALDASPEAFEVCRFYAPGPNTHFYTLANSECESLIASSDWIFESDKFYLYQNNTETGCPAKSVPVYRLYNNRFANNDSNHRYTTQMSIVEEMKTKSWKYEGIAFCAPL